jgi:DNA polymerase III subunit alpha
MKLDRASAFKSADVILAAASAAERDRLGGQSLLFGGSEPEPIRFAETDGWTLGERLQKEFDAVGFFLSGHPLDEFKESLDRLNVKDFSHFTRSVRDGATAGRLAATIISRTERRTKSGSKMGIIMLSDQSGQYEAIIFSEGLQQMRESLEPGLVVLLSVAASLDNDEVRVRIQGVELLAKVMQRVQRGIKIMLQNDKSIEQIAKKLTGKGDGEVSIIISLPDPETEVEIRLAGRYDLNLATVSGIKSLAGVISVQTV